MNLNQGVLIASITMVLAGCDTASMGTGNASDSDGGIDTGLVNESLLQITSDNSHDIASRGVSQSQSIDKDTDPTEYLNNDPRTRFAAKTVRSAFVKTDGFSLRTTETNTSDCDISGSLAISVNDVNNNGTPDNGDSITLDYNKCISGFIDDTSSTDGKVVIRFSKFMDQTNETDIDISIDFDALTMISESDKSVLDGDIGFSSSQKNNVISMTIDGNKLVISSGVDVGIMQDFDMTLTMNETTNAWTQVQNAIFASTDIKGKVVVETLSTMQGVGAENPITGKVKISGANGSYMMIDADSGNSKTLILTTFDGSTTTSDELNWTDLE